MIKGFLNIPWFAWAALALLIAVIYSFLWPHRALTVSTGFRFLVIRWGHALTWLLISVNFILRGLDPKFTGTANVVAAAGGFIYLLFMVMTFVLK
jgi:hypothetical protein